MRDHQNECTAGHSICQPTTTHSTTHTTTASQTPSTTHSQGQDTGQIPWSHPQAGLQHTHTDIICRIGKARTAFNKLQTFWKHTDINIPWKLKVYKSTFIPMLTYGMDSATLTQPQVKRLEAFHAQCIRKILTHKATYYTKVLDESQPTVTNLQVLTEAKVPRITNTIYKQQQKLLGHILRASDSDLTKNVSFTTAFVYRGRGGKQRRGRRRAHWVEQASKISWYYNSHLLPQLSPPHFSPPYSYLQLHRLAQDRLYWHKIVQLPTCREFQLTAPTV